MTILNDLFVKHPKAKLVLKGFAYLFSERMIRFAVGFFVHAIVARHLGPVQFGKLSYVMKTVGVFATFSLFGVDEIILSHLMKGHYKREDVLKTAFSLRFWSASIGYVALGAFILIFQDTNDHFALLTFLYGLQLFMLMFGVFDLDFQSRLDFKPLFWANNISSLSASALRVMGVFANLGVSFFLSTYLLGDLLLRSILQWRLGFQAFKGLFKKELARQIARDSTPFFIATFIVLLDQRVSYFYIEKLLTQEDLGNYSVAVTLVDLWIFFPAAVCAAFFPTIVSAFHDGTEAYHVRKQYLSDMMVWFALLFAVGIYFTADLIIDILYGDRYATAPQVIRFYALVTIPVFFNLARTKWMALEKKLDHWLWICTASLVLNLIGHIFLVPRYGAVGAIVSFLISQLAGNLISCLYLKSARESVTIFLKSLISPMNLLKLVK